jgi:hypothetical protein
VLADREEADRRRAAVRARVEARHAGPVVAAATVAIYERAIAEERALVGRDPSPPLRPILQAAPLLELDGTA